ncbi:hypothetical protein [Curtobacterium sp. MCBA15_004]|uniref:hypothetical protein n=1 Tax=Curtobacterium sp. MCBA15_004 TaxID=1898733 RepID=UPI0015873F5A|nr:hypothetical protein [Curtobacterium sp. MCBA15_004]WIA95787.1 hypothetical protein QOL16_11775 [Curtobacterium sp. MCBA15_004]
MDKERAEEVLELISRYVREQDRAELARAFAPGQPSTEREAVIERFAALFS